jgi:hypothetical protein
MAFAQSDIEICFTSKCDLFLLFSGLSDGSRDAALDARHCVITSKKFAFTF